MVAVVGKKRGVGRGVGLVIITLGIYQCYWWFQAFHEIHAQEKKDFPTGLYLCVFIPFVNLVTVFLYGSDVLKVLNDALETKGLSRTLGIGGFVLWALLPIVGQFVAYAKIQGAINEYWDAESARPVPTRTGPVTFTLA